MIDIALSDDMAIGAARVVYYADHQVQAAREVLQWVDAQFRQQTGEPARAWTEQDVTYVFDVLYDSPRIQSTLDLGWMLIYAVMDCYDRTEGS